jgi:hypothetical protein
MVVYWNNKLLLQLIFGDTRYIIWQLAKKEFFETLALAKESVLLVVNTAILETDPNNPFV